MSLFVHDLPDDPAAWPQWLERQLVGAHLADVVAELEVLQGVSATERASSPDLSGDQLAAVQKQGLSALTAAQIGNLLRHPRRLLAIQAEVLRHGGDYWGGVSRSGDAAAKSSAAWQQIAEACGFDRDRPLPVSTRAENRFEPAAPEPSRIRRRSWLRWSLGTAAAAIVGVGIWLNRPVTRTWGFERGGLLTARISREEYLSSLADAAQDWFKERPEEAATLLQRLREFAHGCDTLIAAPHPQLPHEDGAWLRERCAVWKAKLVADANELEGGRITPLAARDAADEIVRTLQTALRFHAATEPA